MSAYHWAETPMFILRRDCVMRITKDWAPGRFLEMGTGTGELTRVFLERGYEGTCYDLGADNRAIAGRNLSMYGDAVTIADKLSELPHGSFDYVFAFEVLEHIDDDAEALQEWVRYLRPGGRLLLSVPAHMRKFNDEDRAVGHYRRYEKEQLRRLLENAGCTESNTACYGFPLAILTRNGNQYLARRRRKHGDLATSSQEDLSIRSGVERSEASLRLARLLNRRTLAPFLFFQSLFFRSDLGDGYVTHAIYRPADRRADAWKERRPR